DKPSMFHLIRRCSFQIPFKLQKLTGPRLLQYGRNKTACSSLILHLQRDVCLRSRSPSLDQASIHATKLQAFHTSIPLLKKKPPKEPETKALDPTQYSMKSLKDSPKPALYLSLAGLIPFVSAPLVMAIQGTYYPELAFAQITYGAIIVSFLGGIRWGFAVPENSPAKPDWLNLANSTVPPLFAWQALLFKDVTHGAILLVMGLGIALHYDLGLLPTYPSWFKALRIVVTVLAVVSLLATAALKTIDSEKQLSSSTNKCKNTK
ncbi:Transmembrane protein 69, partial [Struthio camelus australis]